jgi:hypothetical protein
MEDKKKKKRQETNCDSCVFYDYDEYYQCYMCRQNLDEDENLQFTTGQFRSCPYYKYYDEYTSVRKQN